jgi:hypothetical protein
LRVVSIDVPGRSTDQHARRPHPQTVQALQRRPHQQVLARRRHRMAAPISDT